MEGFFVKVEQILPDLNHTERKIADYILKNPQDILNLPISELAQRTGVSQAAWVRLCKALGFSGFKEVKREISAGLLSQRMEEDEQGLYSDTREGESLEAVCGRVFSDNVQAISSTRGILDFSRLEQAVEAVSNARRLCFYGVGASGLVALDARDKFLRIGRNAFAFADLHMQLTTAATLASDDCAVIISYSGMTRDIVDVMNAAMDNGATLIGITKYGRNLVSQTADIVLYTCAPEVKVRSGAMSSRIAQLTVIDALFTCVASRMHEKIEPMLRQSHKYTMIRKT